MNVKTVYIALMALCVIVELIFTPLFLHYQRPGISRRSRICKMTSATAYLLLAVFACLYADNRSKFAMLIILALAFSWIGDLFLHIEGKKFFYIGFLGFLAAHVVYVIDWCSAQTALFPDEPILRWYDVAGWLAIIGIEVIVFAGIRKIRMPKAAIVPIGIYVMFLVFSFVKAADLSFYMVKYGAENAGLAAAALSGGAFTFMLSDFSIAALIFSEKYKKDIYLKNHNIGTYFFAQTFFALSVLFVSV